MMKRHVALVFLSSLVLAATACAKEARVRPAAKAGTWYAGDPDVLRKRIAGYLAKAPKLDLDGPPVALIAPHAGYRYSGECAAAGYSLLKGRDVRRVIILAPAHRVGFRGGSIADVDFYETPLGRVPLDREACDAVLKSKLVTSRADVHRDEHSLELQLPFLQVVLKTKWTLVPVVLGRLGDKEYEPLAKVLREHLDAHTVVVASSDFTHYGRTFRYTPFDDDVRNVRDPAARNRMIRNRIESLDKGAIRHVLKLDGELFRAYVEDQRATICGHCPIAVMLAMLTPDCKGQLVRYYLSGDREKDYRHSVSYASVVFTIGPGQVSVTGQRELLDIARAALRATLAGKPLPTPDVKRKELLVRRGVFVTYSNNGRLRGCIGRFSSNEPLWKTVQAMAVASAKHDTRFRRNPITRAEEPNIDIQISVLSPMTRIADPLRFILGVHGLYIKRGWAQGTYLPQVATEQGWDKRTFISHLCEHKIGIAADAWKDAKTEVSIYSAQVFGRKGE
jgi:hypothetical protein